MERVRERELDPLGLHGAAFVRAGHVVRLRALPLEPALQLHERDDRHRAELLGQLYGRAGVVGVSVCDGDHVAAVRVLLRVRALRVVEPGVDVDTLSARRVEAEGGVPEPGQ